MSEFHGAVDAGGGFEDAGDTGVKHCTRDPLGFARGRRFGPLERTRVFRMTNFKIVQTDGCSADRSVRTYRVSEL